MLSSDDFKAFAKQYVMFAHVTTHIEGREHETLLSEKGFNSFPSLAAMNADGDVIAKLTGSRDVDGFREMMAEATKYESILAKTERSQEDELFLLEHDIDMGGVDPAAARARADALDGLDAAQRASIDARLTDLEIIAALGTPNSREEAEALAKRAAATYAAMWAEGREPTSEDAFQPFFILILDHAEAQGDVALFERSLARLRERFAEKSGTEPFFKAQDARLETMRASAADPEAGGGDADAAEEPDGA